jgi:hypothetical protein
MVFGCWMQEGKAQGKSNSKRVLIFLPKPGLGKKNENHRSNRMRRRSRIFSRREKKPPPPANLRAPPSSPKSPGLESPARETAWRETSRAREQGWREQQRRQRAGGSGGGAYAGFTAICSGPACRSEGCRQ